MFKEKIQEIHPLHCVLLMHMAEISGLQQADICNERQLERMKVRQHPRWFTALLLRIQNASQHMAVQSGFEYGQRLDLACAGVIGQAVMSAPTLGVALELMCRYYILTGPKFQFDAKRIGKDAFLSIELDYPNVPDSVRSFVFEALISSWKICSQVLVKEKLTPNYVCFDYKAPAHAHLYESFFQCEVSFNCPQTIIGARSSLLSTPIITANSVVHERSIAICEAALLKRGIVQSLHEKIIRYLRASSDLSQVTLETVAKSLNISSRTLNRRLHQNGESFQKILDEQRCEYACRLLSKSDLKLDRIAEKLGYSDSSNFRRAFKKWTGETPSTYKKRNV